MSSVRMFRAPGGAWEPGIEDPGALDAADSWLVADGRVRGWDRHWARFGAVAGTHGVDTTAFERAVATALPRAGRWFPRVELLPGGALQLRLRPAPPPAYTIACRRDPVRDDRPQPRVKGPDLLRLIALRADAGGAEVLLSPDGDRVAEGALTSLLWWEGDVLWAVPDDAPALPGVTRALLLELARAEGVAIEQRLPHVAELAGCESWLVSALHGIRAVDAWLPGEPAAPAPRAVRWQTRLEALAAPLPQ
jgi:branched-subunit amino acid aminotransferase/4-amino-4-deoxychorismate lyase